IYDYDSARERYKAAQVSARYEHLSEKQLTQQVKKLEKEMLAAARNLEFERAAQLRDELKQLKERLFGVAESG
ncbi:MAG: UvrB/UvrC motif-containing protein, partial [Burkholderiales bacterium]